MGVPTCRHNHRRAGNRNAHSALHKATLSTCAKCHEATLPHHLCKTCGSYAGRTVVNMSARAEKALTSAPTGHEGHDHAAEEKKEA